MTSFFFHSIRRMITAYGIYCAISNIAPHLINLFLRPKSWITLGISPKLIKGFFCQIQILWACLYPYLNFAALSCHLCGFYSLRRRDMDKVYVTMYRLCNSNQPINGKSLCQARPRRCMVYRCTSVFFTQMVNCTTNDIVILSMRSH